MSRIPWYYIWSPKYEIFHAILQDIFHHFPKLKESFSLRPIFIEQSYFSQHLQESQNVHAFTGCSLKVDILLSALENNLGNYVLFTDIDILILKENLRDILQPSMEKNMDMVFLKEHEMITNRDVNIGFCFIHANEKTIHFWKQVKEQITSNAHDQAIVNQQLQTFPGTWEHFDQKHVVCQNILKSINDCVVLQMLSTINTRTSEFIEKLYSYSFLIELEKYKHILGSDLLKTVQKLKHE